MDGATRHWAWYASLVVIGPSAWILLWLMAFGFKGVDLAAPAAIPGWLALAVAPVIGIVLGWRLPVVEGLRRRILVLASGPLAVAAVPFLITQAGSQLALLALAVLYAFGPLVIGRFLKVTSATLRHRFR